MMFWIWFIFGVAARGLWDAGMLAELLMLGLCVLAALRCPWTPIRRDQ